MNDDMTPEQIELNSTHKMFEYEKIARELDSCDDIEVLRNLAKVSIKLMFKQQETLKAI